MSNIECGSAESKFIIHHSTFIIQYSVLLLMEVGIILLAAGSSSRMGQSKQLLKIKEVAMLVYSITIALESGMHPVVVVLGANEEEHRKAIVNLDIDIISNPAWNRGMGSSLKVGLNYLSKHASQPEAVIVMVCDQPLLTGDHLKKIKEKYLESNKSIVASHYSGTVGVPVLFHKILFSEIMALPDDHGAKMIIQQHPNDTFAIDFPEGSIDLDTPNDYRNFGG